MSCFRHEKKIVQGTVQKVINATAIWLTFYQTLEKTKICWTKNQCPNYWSLIKVHQMLDNIITRSKDELKINKSASKSETRTHEKSVNFLQFRDNRTQHFAGILRKLIVCQLVSIKRKLRSRFPTVKISFNRNLKLYVLYENQYKKYGFIYVKDDRLACCHLYIRKSHDEFKGGSTIAEFFASRSIIDDNGWLSHRKEIFDPRSYIHQQFEIRAKNSR